MPVQMIIEDGHRETSWTDWTLSPIVWQTSRSHFPHCFLPLALVWRLFTGPQLLLRTRRALIFRLLNAGGIRFLNLFLILITHLSFIWKIIYRTTSLPKLPVCTIHWLLYTKHYNLSQISKFNACTTQLQAEKSVKLHKYWIYLPRATKIGIWSDTLYCLFLGTTYTNAQIFVIFLIQEHSRPIWFVHNTLAQF